MGGNDLTFSMLFRLMDQWSGPGDKIRASMRRVSRSAQDMRRDLGKKIKTGFSEDELEAALTRNENRISKSRQRLLGAAAMAVAIGTPVIQEGNFQERLIDFANLAEIGQDRVALLREELDALRKQTGQSKLQLLDGLEAYVGKGMGLDEALAGMRATGRAAKATKSAMGEMANSGYAVMDNLGLAPTFLHKAFDVMAKSGKEGSFELAAMARKFPEITAGAKSLKMEGIDAVASLSAALQIAMKAAGSEDQAATNMTNFLGKITAPDTVKKFHKFGVDIEKEMQIALARGADPLEHMLLVIKEMTGGDAFKMGKLFQDKQVLDFLRAMIPNMDEFNRIKNEGLAADGVIDADYERVLKGFNAQWTELKNSVSSLTGASGSLLPVITDIMGQIRWGVEGLITWTNANPELTATIIKGTAALLAFGIATRVVGFGFAVMQGGLLRTAGLFFKFNKAGKNMSMFARSTRGAKWALGGFLRKGKAAAGLFGKPLKWAITPLKWTSRLIPAVPWKKMPLGKFGMNAAGWGRLITPLKWFARAGLRFIPVIGWAALAFDIGMFAWKYFGLSELPWADYIKTGWTWVDKLPPWSWVAIIGGPITFGPLLVFKWRDILPEWRWGEIIPDLFSWLTGSAPEGSKRPATPLSPSEKTAYQSDLRAEIANLEAQIAKINDGPMSQALKRPFANELAALKAEMASIMAPIATAMREGQKSAYAPTSSPRPGTRPGDQAYGSSQPNVTVESAFESNSSLDVSVQVSMPIHITKEQQKSNRQIAADAGKQIGSQTERAIRRSLDDAAVTE